MGILKSKFSDEHIFMAEMYLFRAELKYANYKFFDSRHDVGKAILCYSNGINSLHDMIRAGSAYSARANEFLKILNNLIKDDEKHVNVKRFISRKSTRLLYEDFTDKLSNNNEAGVGSSTDENDDLNTDVRYKGSSVPLHPMIIDCFILRAELCYELGDYEECKSLAANAISLSEELYSNARCITVAKAFLILASVTLMTDDLRSALDQHQQALLNFEEILPNDHFLILKCRNRLAKTFFEMSNFEESSKYYFQNLENVIKIYGEFHFLPFSSRFAIISSVSSTDSIIFHM
jgi:tetratricopeptide (TPR) repeat protein